MAEIFYGRNLSKPLAGMSGNSSLAWHQGQWKEVGSPVRLAVIKDKTWLTTPSEMKEDHLSTALVGTVPGQHSARLPIVHQNRTRRRFDSRATNKRKALVSAPVAHGPDLSTSFAICSVTSVKSVCMDQGRNLTTGESPDRLIVR